MFRSLLVALLLTIGLASPAAAQLQLNNFFIDLGDGQSPGELYAANRGDETLYLQVTVEEVLNPGSEEEETVRIYNPREAGVLVSPQRLVAQPGEEKRIRIVALDGTDTDRFFKLTVTPVVGDLESEDAIGVKVMIAYAAWVFLRPEGAEPEIVAEQTGDRFTVRNNGNTHAEITGIKQCEEDGACEDLTKFRLLAGSEKTLELETEAPVTAKVLFAGKNTALEIRRR